MPVVEQEPPQQQQRQSAVSANDSFSAPQLDKDLEAAFSPTRATRPEQGRASVPHSRPTSMHSGRSRGDGDGDDDAASEYAWGPSHPCFPHPNPHVPLDSPLYETTRIIRVKRDWLIKGDLAPTFANLYPEILDPMVSEDEFREIIKKINDRLIKAFDPLGFRAWLDAFMGVATLWLWDDVGLTGVKKELKELERWIEDWNRKSGEPEGVRIIPLRRTGYLTLDIQIPDPHIGVDTMSSRPHTQQDDLQTTGLGPNQTRDFAPYPITPTLQIQAGSPTAIESRS